MFRCSVCSKNFVGMFPEKVFSTPCGHLFHSDCILLCLNKYVNYENLLSFNYLLKLEYWVLIILMLWIFNIYKYTLFFIEMYSLRSRPQQKHFAINCWKTNYFVFWEVLSNSCLTTDKIVIACSVPLVS